MKMISMELDSGMRRCDVAATKQAWRFDVAEIRSLDSATKARRSLMRQKFEAWISSNLGNSDLEILESVDVGCDKAGVQV